MVNRVKKCYDLNITDNRKILVDQSVIFFNGAGKKLSAPFFIEHSREETSVRHTDKRFCECYPDKDKSATLDGNQRSVISPDTTEEWGGEKEARLPQFSTNTQQGRGYVRSLNLNSNSPFNLIGSFFNQFRFLFIVIFLRGKPDRPSTGGVNVTCPSKGGASPLINQREISIHWGNPLFSIHGYTERKFH